MHMLKLLVSLATVLAGMMAVGAFIGPGANSAHAAGPGSCGVYMHWRDGECIDARNREGAPWAQQMGNKKAAW
jgi:hypothetical protein